MSDNKQTTFPLRACSEAVVIGGTCHHIGFDIFRSFDSFPKKKIVCAIKRAMALLARLFVFGLTALTAVSLVQVAHHEYDHEEHCALFSNT